MMNMVVIGGNLVAAPELKYTTSGSAVANLTVAINSKYKGANGQTKEQVDFIDVVCWGKQAESAAEYLDKGCKVLVQGALKQQKWTGRDGHNRTKIEVWAQRINFLTFKKSAVPAGGNGASAPHDDVPVEDDVPF